MKLLINSQYLAQELRALNRVVPSKPVLPILSHVLFRADGTLTMQATDLEVTASAPCQATIEAPGTAALPAAKLLSLCEHFPDQEVSILHDGGKATIESGRFKSVLQTLSSNDFPVLPEVDGETITIDAARLRHLIARTRYAVASSETQRVLRGALLTMVGRVAAMVATDGKRVSLATVAREGPDASFVISAKALDALAATADQGEIGITVGERHLFFSFGSGSSAGGKLLTARILNGQFPKYERIIPRSNQLKVTMDRADLIASLHRVVLLGDEENHAVTFNVSPGALRLSARSADVGSADEEVQATYDGPEVEIRANGEHVLDFLNAAVEPSVTLALKDGKAPLLFQDGEGHLGVVASISK